MRRVLAALLCLAACSRTPAATLDIATTTSVQNSGLLAYLLPQFQRHSAIVVRVHAAGSGRALQMLEDEVVDLVISHAPEAEARILTRHPQWSYRKLAHNRFVVAGPGNDPASVSGAADVLDAFRRIARSDAAFVSRGDESGTHERERALWAAAGIDPDPARVIVSGRGMAQALRHADEAEGYVLTDEATFRQMDDALDLEIVAAGDPRLVNSYAVLHRGGEPRATAFADWLTGEAGRAALGALTIAGAPAFTPWPPDCPGGQPSDAACGPR
ncbi:MAG TPA: substrate-binding domain-containing protein [Vicinamibacterales bacterium]|nr:substrate-binding domain-containing protein [Vicinamibacterales bacterium]